MYGAQETVWNHKIHRNGGEEDDVVPGKTEGTTSISPMQHCKNPKAIFKSSSVQQTKWHLDFFLSFSLQLPYVLFKRGIFSAYPIQVNSNLFIDSKVTSSHSCSWLFYPSMILLLSWGFLWVQTESPFLWRLLCNPASVKKSLYRTFTFPLPFH